MKTALSKYSNKRRVTREALESYPKSKTYLNCSDVFVFLVGSMSDVAYSVAVSSFRIGICSVFVFCVDRVTLLSCILVSVWVSFVLGAFAKPETRRLNPLHPKPNTLNPKPEA